MSVLKSAWPAKTFTAISSVTEQKQMILMVGSMALKESLRLGLAGRKRGSNGLLGNRSFVLE